MKRMTFGFVMLAASILLLIWLQTYSVENFTSGTGPSAPKKPIRSRIRKQMIRPNAK